ncbi:hypothetical protein [Haloferax sp. DFSO52]|uniref:hypothetical protein n=1 Tax=Haloferax sp. DFSO52 TaxID=3388505 RepID=UPI003A84C2E0
MAENSELHDELDALARELEQAILEFDAVLERHALVRQRNQSLAFDPNSVEFDDVQELFF